MIQTPSTDDRPTLLDAALAAGEINAELIVPGAPTPTVPAAAQALGVGEAQILKSLLFTDEAGGVVLAIACGHTRVDRDRLATFVGGGKLKMASPEVVLEQTGYPAGGVPPVAHVNSINIVIDSAVMELSEAYAGGGRDGAMLRIAPREIVRVTGARVADIAS